ncbi:MAG: aldehyde dehydrogenase family protein [Mesorhizobium sp.]
MTAQTGLPIDGKMYIGGRWTLGQATRTIAVHSPATEELVGTVPEGTSGDAEDALAAARAAQRAWAALPPIERARMLRRLCALLDRDRERIARIITLEQGKPIAQARGEVGGAIGFIEFAADNARRIEGDIIPSDNAGEEIWIRRVPYGVVVALTAWNYPVALAGRKLGPALAAGNTIVLKSHELTPLSLLEIGRLCEEAGIPAGVVNIVSGTGREVGDALVRSPLSDVVTMTGSVRAGREIYAAAAESLKVIRLELGGKAPFIVMDDADIDAAVDAAIIARFTNCGQICTCNERMYLHARIADRFLEAFVSRAAALTVGDPFQQVDLGPKISRPELEKVAAMVDEAVAGGAELLTGGHRLSGDAFAKGHWFEPTVMLAPSNKAPIMQNEIFGPVVPVMRVRDFDEALTLANESAFGLSAYLFTADLHRVMRFNRESAFGELYINRTCGEMVQGFHSGWKSSGLGGEDGKYGFDAYLRKKTAYIAA